MIRLQRCTDCGTAQYPPREVCGTCLSDRLACESAEFLSGRVMARTLLRHSNDNAFRSRLPLVLGLVRLDAGPVALCLLAAQAAAGDVVQVRRNADALLEAT